MAKHLGCAQAAVVDVRYAADGRLGREVTDHLFGCAALRVDLLQVSEGLHEEQRRDVGEVEVVEPYRLVQAQRLQRRLVEDREGSRQDGDDHGDASDLAYVTR